MTVGFNPTGIIPYKAMSFGANPKKALKILQENGVTVITKKIYGGKFTAEFKAKGLPAKTINAPDNISIHGLPQYPLVSYTNPKALNPHSRTSGDCQEYDSAKAAKRGLLERLPDEAHFSVDYIVPTGLFQGAYGPKSAPSEPVKNFYMKIK